MVNGHGRQDRAIVRPMLVKKPTHSRINDSAPYVRFGVGFHGSHLKFQSRKGSNPRDHPYQRQVREPAVDIATTYVGMRAREPCLLDVPPWLLSLRYRPEGWDKRTTVLVDGHGMQCHINVLAEACIVETEEDQRYVSGQRSKAKACGDAVRTDRVPNGHAFYRPAIVKSLALCGRLVFRNFTPICRGCSPWLLARCWTNSVVFPGDLEQFGIRSTCNARCTNQSRQCACRVRSARKTANVNLITCFIII